MKELNDNAVNRAKPDSKQIPNLAETLEAIYGCKWSIRILTLIRNGINRPGAIEKALPGLTTKVQNYYFKRMQTLGVLERVVFAEVPPRVEYQLTPFGSKFMPILDSIERLQHELNEERIEPHT